MKILLLSQVFYPDVVSVAQHVADLSAELGAAGHEVNVLCSSRGYDDADVVFPKTETWKGVRIRRVWTWGLGKKSKLRRIVGFASFFGSSLAALFTLPKQDIVVVVPPPPLLSVLAALFVMFRGGRMVYWSMDLNPDEAIAAGWMAPDSLAARFLNAALSFSLRRSSRIVVLDRFMKDRIVHKGVPAEKIQVIPPWAHDQFIFYDPAGRHDFRRRYGLDDKFVVMYSGNHSPLHPLDTLLQSALRLQNNPDIVFLFVGGGSEFARVKQFAVEFGLSNVVCLPYQPLDLLSASLSAADLQVVLLGDPFVGIVHPCKIYNILAVGAPFLYVGPNESHITDLRQYQDIALMGQFIRHGDVDHTVNWITQLSSDFVQGKSSRSARPPGLDRFSERSLAPVFVELIEAL